MSFRQSWTEWWTEALRQWKSSITHFALDKLQGSINQPTNQWNYRLLLQWFHSVISINITKMSAIKSISFWATIWLDLKEAHNWIQYMQRRTVVKYFYPAQVHYKCLYIIRVFFFGKLYFTTFQSIISYFLLHYISYWISFNTYIRNLILSYFYSCKSK